MYVRDVSQNKPYLGERTMLGLPAMLAPALSCVPAPRATSETVAAGSGVRVPPTVTEPALKSPGVGATTFFHFSSFAPGLRSGDLFFGRPALARKQGGRREDEAETLAAYPFPPVVLYSLEYIRSLQYLRGR